jgi:hypothetical protein
MELM